MRDAIQAAIGSSELGQEAGDGELGSFALFGAAKLIAGLAAGTTGADAALTDLGGDALTIAGRGADAVSSEVEEFKASDSEGRWWLWRQMADEAAGGPTQEPGPGPGQEPGPMQKPA